MDLLEVANRKGELRRHPWELARFNVVNKLLKEVIRNEDDYTVLDIGCGDIYFVSRLSDLYPKINFFAIDTAFDDDAIFRLTNQVGNRKIKLFKTMDEASLVLKKAADLILLLDVVEHIEHDEAFLRSLHDNPAVRSSTNIMITVPAFQTLFCSHDAFLGHYRRYTNSTLKKVLQRAGFKENKIGYFFSSLIPTRLAQVFKEKITKSGERHTTGLVQWKGGQLITGLMKSVLLLDYYFFSFIKRISGINIPGLSNYVICKKPA
jgi:hypothetical protein